MIFLSCATSILFWVVPARLDGVLGWLLLKVNVTAVPAVELVTFEVPVGASVQSRIGALAGKVRKRNGIDGMSGILGGKYTLEAT